MVIGTCEGSVNDVHDVEHSVEGTTETLYEAKAIALAVLQNDVWILFATTIGNLSPNIGICAFVYEEPRAKQNPT